MEIVFGIVVVTVSLVAAAVAFLTYLRVGDLYRQIGRSYLTDLDRDDSRKMSSIAHDAPRSTRDPSGS
jgi:hypothetical protein